MEKEPIAELFQMFRSWNKDWEFYGKKTGWEKPITAEEFMNEVRNKFNITYK